MKFVALVSGGKDSCFSIQKCLEEGHQLVAIANLRPKEGVDELDSYMYQSVGHEVIEAYSHCIGTSIEEGLEYFEAKRGDEVEDLFDLLQRINGEIPGIEAVSSGAILSTYQRNRVESVDQLELLNEMVTSGINAIMIKVAAIGLLPNRHLGKTLSQLQPHLLKIVHPCGEGGEYETLTLDAPYFLKRIIVDASEIIYGDGIQDSMGGLAHLRITSFHLEDKSEEEITVWRGTMSRIDKEATATHKKIPIKLHSIMGLSGHETDQSLEAQFETISAELKGDFMYRKESLNTIDILEHQGSSMNQIYYVYVYIRDMNRFVEMNNLYKRMFNRINPPARACISTILPRGRDVMMDCMIMRKDIEKTSHKTLHVQSVSQWAPASIGPYSQAKMVDGILYQAGQIGLVPNKMILCSDDTNSQLEQIVDNINAVYKSFDHIPSHCMSLTVYMINKEDLEMVQRRVEEIEGHQNRIVEYVGVTALPRNSNIEIQSISTSCFPLEIVHQDVGRIKTAILLLGGRKYIYHAQIREEQYHLSTVQGIFDLVQQENKSMEGISIKCYYDIQMDHTFSQDIDKMCEEYKIQDISVTPAHWLGESVMSLILTIPTVPHLLIQDGLDEVNQQPILSVLSLWPKVFMT
ncbi:meiotically up-regulated 71 protein [Planoprotostelium fungivorum]|uniref:Diphthine--ammonia ligase n=1 Tax=Planoprotostelium fungivorum TaxID=1890364 RepID=A0A2P6NVQ7_9EUKA|nr:meiotically up-regulated 71 protein [Planoprotostelium fungivorum]